MGDNQDFKRIAQESELHNGDLIRHEFEDQGNIWILAAARRKRV